jgi:hypothetical protein
MTANHQRPPNQPWQKLRVGAFAGGYASFYYADELGALPVRAITKLKDNKSDPNIETGTYGLFSTCEEKMRSGIVRDPPQHLFFVTRLRSGGRHLTGYYELGWYTEGALRRRTRDFALAADRMRWVDPLPLSSLPEGLDAILGGRWRLNKRLERAVSLRLVALLDSRPDRTSAYVREVDRLERINEYHSGFRYPSWRRHEPFSWRDAEHYLREVALDPAAPKVRNASPTGWWRCANCTGLVENKALLKACPHCKQLDGLRPATQLDLVESP